MGVWLTPGNMLHFPSVTMPTILVFYGSKCRIDSNVVNRVTGANLLHFYVVISVHIFIKNAPFCVHSFSAVTLLVWRQEGRPAITQYYCADDRDLRPELGADDLHVSELHLLPPTLL